MIVLGVISIAARLAAQPPVKSGTLPVIQTGAAATPEEAAASGKTTLVVWGLASGEDTEGQDAEVAAFERQRHVRVQMLSMGAGGMNQQKLMTAIAGHVPPDLVNQDRFTIGDWASRNAFLPLDHFIQTDTGPDRIRERDYYHACWAEATYKGHVYAIPNSTDDRALYYNKKLLREAGIARPPATWEELYADTVKLTKYDSNGNFKQIGFIPNYGNSWLYLYSWQNGGEFMSPDGRTCTMANPRTVGALDFMVKVYDALHGASHVNAYTQTFQPNALDPFLTGQVAMKIDGNWVLDSIGRYAPANFEFGVAPAPVPAARLAHRGIFKGVPDYITWSGGFSYAMPIGCRHPKLAWDFIKWMNSLKGQRIRNRAQQQYYQTLGRIYVPTMSANQPVNIEIFKEFAPPRPALREGMKVFLNLMPLSKFRPVTFVGQTLWDQQVDAFDEATHHETTHISAQQALQTAQAHVQTELNRAFSVQDLPLLNWRTPLAILAALAILVLAGTGLWWSRQPRLGKLGRSEAMAGLLFASPWIFGFLVFTLGPMLASIVYSFCDYDVLHPARYLGLTNYRNLIFHEPLLWPSLYNAGWLAFFSIPLGLVVGLGIALLLNTKVRGMSSYRTAFYLPSITPIVAQALLWPWILDPTMGPLNVAWNATLGPWFHLQAPGWLADPNWSKASYVLLSLWTVGGGMILWLAGLQGVPRSLYEAAEIDGASSWQQFKAVTLPYLTPYIFFNLIIGTIGSLQRFSDVYMMSGPTGGPVNSTMVPVLLLFNNAFQYFKMGYASALAWIIFVLVLIPSLFQVWLSRRWVYYEGGAAK